MSRYNEELAKAGALIGLDGLHPPSVGSRIGFSGGKPNVSHGPFSGVTNVLGGYWMIEAKSREEAVEWATRVPAEDGDIIEIRQVFEMSDFPAETQKAADSAPVRAAVEKHKSQ